MEQPALPPLAEQQAIVARLDALYAKTRYFDGPGTHPLVLGVLDHVLGHYQFSAPVGIQIGPGEVARADGVDVDREPGAPAGDRARRARVVQVDVREEHGADIF